MTNDSTNKYSFGVESRPMIIAIIISVGLSTVAMSY